MRPLVYVLLAVTLACRVRGDPGHGEPGGVQDAADQAFAAVQSRGQVAMGVDQYTSSHVFEALPDGGRISLQRDVVDSAGVAEIRAHLRHIAGAFAQGDFQLPGFVHAQAVPGTAEMRTHRARIRYTMDTLPSGGQVRIRSDDTTAVRAIHEFLAFQRADHRVAEHHRATP